jgi:hypothetical protein
MTRLSLATLLLVSIAPVATAQPGALPPIPPPLAPPPPNIAKPIPVTPSDTSTVPPGLIPNPIPLPPTYKGEPGPAMPFYKSGGIIVGSTGYFPYDTGSWLLGGIDGQTRQSGAYTMVYPEGNSSAPTPTPTPQTRVRTPLFFRSKPRCP